MSNAIHPNTYDLMPLTGKTSRKQEKPISLALMVPVMPESEHIEERVDVVNDATKSGKQKGALVLDFHHNLYIATGGKPDSEWIKVSRNEIIVPA
ncbi:hypothetical protein [Klebsiella phage pKP-M186-2.1]|nr:hypothetical protein [Klebsiella phage pKP-M186-2.1]